MLLRLFRKIRFLSKLLLMGLCLSVLVPGTLAQDTNVCRDFQTTFIEYDETITSTVDTVEIVQLFCFEAERGDEITVIVQPLSGNLVADVSISTPFLDPELGLTDEPLALSSANEMGAEVELEAEIDEDGTYLIVVSSLQQTIGEFAITLELGEVATLGSGGDNNTTDDSGNNNGEENGATNPLQPQGLCDFEDTLPITIGETVTGSLPDGGIPVFYCFDGIAGDIVFIEALITDGNADLVFIISTPDWDLQSQAGILAQGVAPDDDQPAIGEFVIQESGQYVLILVALNQRDGDYELTLTSDVANVFSCDNEPLATVTGAQWGILDADAETPLVTLNVGCGEILSFGTLGIMPALGIYTVTQDGTLSLALDDRFYDTVSITEEEWVIERDDGTQFTFVRISEDDACTSDEKRMLINGSWEWDVGGGQILVFDFTCNDLVIVDFVEEIVTLPYEYDIEGEAITIDLGGGQIIEFEEIEFDGDQLEATFQGSSVDLVNRNYVEPEEVDTEE